jgi:hypothetical protein
MEAGDGIRARFRKSTPTIDEEDVEHEEVEEGREKCIFCMTWIELGLGLLLLAAWTCTSSPSSYNSHKLTS